MIGRLVIAIALILAASSVAAQGPTMSEGPVKVTADKFTVDQAQSEATFTGNVVIQRDDLTVWASEVVVLYGDAGMQDIESLVASGGVRLKTSDQDATGEKATFDPSSQILHLTGNVKVTNESGTFNGPELTLNLAEQTTVFSSAGGGGRVTGVFTPQ